MILCNSNKIDNTVVKSYLVISLLNCLGMVCRKVVAEMLADWCEVDNILNKGPMGSRRQRCIIDAVY